MSKLVSLKHFIHKTICIQESRIDRLLGCRDLKRRYADTFGQDPDLKTPSGFSEKVQWRKLNDRNPYFPVFADRLRCREYFKTQLGDQQANDLMPRLLWHGAASADIPFDDLQAGAILKANHGSGWNVRLEPGEIPDQKAVRRKCDAWLGKIFGQEMHEWGYRQARPLLVAEEMARQDDGGPISDLKCFVFNGKIGFLYVVQYSTGNCGLFRPDWTRLDASLHLLRGHSYGVLGDIPIPPYFSELKEVALRLGSGFDMLRVDFLVSDNRFWLGEITVYPTSGNGYFDPPAFEQEAGDMWTLPSKG
ncbi:TupA-like ATPgrasp [Shimia gijangensis]|uniref:TupA-like ATPgrasp n=1 Tax=Shimia gijangensis TaxID=1470563 RepID=A0A1M6IKW4_9RHOB|nr:ATP-grasp fold amidoligase family protein [Shimia gijangensis]SHJ35088.1 TupA-like ATPgrasp [Shimia gijangensis]